MKKLHISRALSLPLDVVTQTLAAVARKGAGKTYFATLLAELMRRAGAQVIAIDIVGNWFGLRLGPGGRGRGVDIYVFGGEHGDIPLTPDSGPRIARLLVERPISAVLDISSFRKAERLRFAAQFAEEFFHLKKTQRSPVHVFVEEAQKLIPQVVRGESAAMVGAWEDIVRLGRNYGIGCTLVTQRPQSVNKEVLSQVECLVALQVNGVHERKALEEWVQEKGADRALVGELPGLAVGEAYVWSPSWLRIFEKVKIATKGTYDASATPEVGKRRRSVKLSHADVKALREELAEVVTKAERDDPSALKRRIAELERALVVAMKDKPIMPGPQPTKITKISSPKEVLVLRAREAKRLEKAVAKAHKVVEQAHSVADSVAALVAARVEKTVGKMPEKFTPVTTSLKAAGDLGRQLDPRIDPRIATAQKRFLHQQAKLDKAVVARTDHLLKPTQNGEARPLKAGARTMLRVLAGATEPMSRTALAVHAVISQTGGTFSDYLSALRSNGYIDETGTGEIEISATAAPLVLSLGGPLRRGAAELADAWGKTGRLKAGARRMLAVLMARGETARPNLATAAEITSTGGTFSDYLSTLRSAGLIEEDGQIVKPAGCLYVRGA